MEVWIMIIAMFALMYFLMIRPENKRKKEAQNMRDSLAVGDEITTIGGITGTICAVKENTIVIESGADRVRVELTKWAVSTKRANKRKSRNRILCSGFLFIRENGWPPAAAIHFAVSSGSPSAFWNGKDGGVFSGPWPQSGGCAHG